ncbi:MAG: hypothetical protein J0M12_03690 [Deltaproteobacteria bacterium]|nr:hypothetical protein [Deltaproteobacteria bacterium]
MQPTLGPSAPKEIRPLLTPFDISEVEKQLHDATVMWNGGASIEIALRGPSVNVRLYFTPISYAGSTSLLVQARLTDDGSVALSLEKLNLHAIIITTEEQEPLIAKPEAHALALSDVRIGTTYLLQVMHPPAVPRGTNEVMPTDDHAHPLSESGMFELSGGREGAKITGMREHAYARAG